MWFESARTAKFRKGAASDPAQNELILISGSSQEQREMLTGLKTTVKKLLQNSIHTPVALTSSWQFCVPVTISEALV